MMEGEVKRDFFSSSVLLVAVAVNGFIHVLGFLESVSSNLGLCTAVSKAQAYEPVHAVHAVQQVSRYGTWDMGQTNMLRSRGGRMRDVDGCPDRLTCQRKDPPLISGLDQEDQSGVARSCNATKIKNDW